MPIQLKKSNSTFKEAFFDEPVITSIPAQLKEFPSGWVIEYYVINPDTKKLERKREKFERMRKRFGNDAEARKEAKKICRNINKKLASGWNPMITQSNARMYTTLKDAMHNFMEIKSKEIRKDSLRCYTSQINIFSTWIKRYKLEDTYVSGFTPIQADDYINFVYVNNKLSPRTFNNYVRFWRSAWNWFIERGYSKENPFLAIKKKKEEQKKREVIPPEWDKKILDYCAEHNPRLAFVCMLVYSAFLRPKEICQLKIKDIHLEMSAIYVDGTVAKMGKQRWAILTPDMVQMIREMHLERYDPEWYIVSTGLKPGIKMTNTRKVDKYWDKMRSEINMPMKYQLYSYRDTGITYLKSQGVPDYMIINLTGHESIEMLKKYTHAPKMEALAASAQYLPSLGKRE